jgi:hypothetical protein
MSDEGKWQPYNPDGWGCGKDVFLVLVVVFALCLAGWLA